MPEVDLLPIYLQFITLMLVGWFLGRCLPTGCIDRLGKFLFWVGIPLGTVAFLRRANLSFSLWMAPVTAWLSILVGVGVAWAYLCWRSRQSEQRYLPATKGSFLLTSMLGNTGYIGYPVALAISGPDYFPWAILFDFGSTFGSYGFGVILAAHFGVSRVQSNLALQALTKNPTLWAMLVSFLIRPVPFPDLLDRSLLGIGWLVIALALMLMGMRLSQISSLQRVRLALVSVSIKMLLVPLLVSGLLLALGITGTIHRVMLIQTAMPPAFATLVISEAYDLDKTLTVTSLTIGSFGLLLTLPLWLWLLG